MVNAPGEKYHVLLYLKRIATAKKYSRRTLIQRLCPHQGFIENQQQGQEDGSQYGSTEGQPIVVIKVDNTSTTFKAGDKVFINSTPSRLYSSSGLPLLAEIEELNEWEQSNITKLEEAVHEIRGNPEDDLWNDAWTNKWNQWAYFTAKEWTHDDCVVCTAGRCKLKVVPLPYNTQTCLAFRQILLAKYG